VLWDVKSKEIIQRVEGHKGKGVCFWVDVHGETMASAGQDGTVKVYRNMRNSESVNGKVAEKEKEEALEVSLPIRHEDVKMEDS
jgi:COMPASS component SWD3